MEERGTDARRNLLKISSNGKSLLRNVNTTTAYVAAVLRRDRIEVDSGCFYGWCPNLKSRYSISTGANKITVDLIELQTERNKPDLISFDRPIQSEDIPSNNGEVFDSRKLKEEEAMAAWCLFKDKAGDSVDVPSIHGTTKDVAREFKGLPLAIIIVAGARKRKIKPSWEDSLRKLRRAEARNIHGVYEKVYKCLRRSYDHLGENEVSTSFCFVLCSRKIVMFGLKNRLNIEWGLAYFWELKI